MHSKPVRYLVLIEAAGAMVARLFTADRRQIADIDASSEEVAVMTAGVVPRKGVDERSWGAALGGHSAQEKAAALVYELEL